MPETTLKNKFITPSIVYSVKFPELIKMMDVWGGTASLREGGEKYCPKLRFESEQDYAMRLKTLAIKNYLRDAITGYVGRIFSKETVLGKDVPPDIVEWWEDIDRAGNKGDVFFKRVVTSGIRDGVSWVLVDMPVSTAQTLADERQQDIRPYVRMYRDLDVIYAEIDDRGHVIDFRARETTYETQNMEQVKVEKIRRLTPGLCEIYDTTHDTYETFNVTYPAKYGVPVVPYITDPSPKSGFLTESPLRDMAELIIRLWRSQAEQDNSLAVARCPMLFGKSVDLEKLIVSAKSVITSDNENAQLSWVESSGNALQSGKDDIDTLKAAIEAESLKPLQQADNSRTRYEAKSDDAKTTSPIKNMADAAQDMIENVLVAMARWTGKEDGGSVVLNSNFDLVDYDASEVSTLVNLQTQGLITKSTLLKEIKRRGVLSDDLDIEAELEAVGAEDHGIEG